VVVSVVAVGAVAIAALADPAATVAARVGVRAAAAPVARHAAGNREA
jgi:hypothetical protein